MHTQTAFFMEATSRGMRLLKTLAEKDTLETHGYNRIIRKGIGGYMKAFLILEDGTVFTGTSIGSKKDMISEIVFNTSMTGYLEVLTDPSYAGQAVVMTYPLIGNY